MGLGDPCPPCGFISLQLGISETKKGLAKQQVVMNSHSSFILERNPARSLWNARKIGSPPMKQVINSGLFTILLPSSTSDHWISELSSLVKASSQQCMRHQAVEGAPEITKYSNAEVQARSPTKNQDLMRSKNVIFENQKKFVECVFFVVFYIWRVLLLLPGSMNIEHIQDMLSIYMHIYIYVLHYIPYTTQTGTTSPV